MEPTKAEPWVRVTLNLPNRSEPERRAYAQIVQYLEGLRTSRLGVRGYTEVPETRGMSWSEQEQRWVEDIVTLLIFDAEAEAQVPWLLQALGELRGYCFEAYRQQGVPQEDIWVMTTANALIR